MDAKVLSRLFTAPTSPAADVRVESEGPVEGLLQRRHPTSIPVTYILVKSGRALEHRRQVRAGMASLVLQQIPNFPVEVESPLEHGLTPVVV